MKTTMPKPKKTTLPTLKPRSKSRYGQNVGTVKMPVDTPDEPTSGMMALKPIKPMPLKK